MVFLFISGYVDRPILDQVIAEQFLQKPISRALLLGKVHELLHLPEGRERSVGA
jgi:response regulator RpfG family c-di-GMP phosphodiesterase